MQKDKDMQTPDAVAVTIGAKFDDWSGKRQRQETQMIADTMQYDGKYTDAEKTTHKFSSVFINYTRPKVDYLTSRVIDLLIPADGSPNWNIENTPVPELHEALKQATDEFDGLKAQLEEAGKAAEAGNQEAAQAAEQIIQRLDQTSLIYGDFKNQTDTLSKTCDNARAVMNDQLKRCLYESAVTDAIKEGFKLGAGVIKGPVASPKPKKQWQRVNKVDEQGQEVEETEYQLNSGEDTEPEFKHVSLWNYYPDPTAINNKSFVDTIELHLMNKDALRKLQFSGFDEDAIRHLLKSDLTQSAPNFITQLNAVNSNKAELSGEYFRVLEYTGCLEYEDFKALAESTGQTDLVSEEDDPLKAYYGIVWVCQGKVLKFRMFPYDREEQFYHVYTPIPVEGSLIGRSMTSILHDSQAMLNASARALLDNAGVTSGPQIVIDKNSVEPENGDWTIEAWKVWISNPDNYTGTGNPFMAVHLESRQSELAANMAIAMAHMDKESAIPEQATGEATGSVNHTAMGTAILTNQGLIRYKGYITLFDQQITKPNIRGLYDWNMQFNKREDIKGDMEIVATGASSLLVRELQAHSLLALTMQLSQHPKFGVMLKDKSLLKKVLSAHSIPATDVMKSDEEIDAIIAEQQQPPPEEAAPPPDPMMELKQDEMQLKLAEINSRIAGEREKMIHQKDMAIMARDTEMLKLAGNGNVEIEKLAMRMDDNREKEMAKVLEKAQDAENTQRQIMAEAQVALETGVHAGGLV
jgi:hypothetical protein